MRRSLACRRRYWTGKVSFVRGRHPADPPSGRPGDEPTAVYRPAEKRVGFEVISRIPARVEVGSREYVLKGGKADGLRIMPPEVIDALDLLDEEWKRAEADFRRKWADLIEDGYARGRTLRLSDLEPETRA